MYRGNKGYMSRIFKKILYIYAAILCLMGIWASYSSYEKNRNEFYNEIDTYLLLLNKEFENSTENFWRLYMPVFENKERVYNALRIYFNSDDKENLTPQVKKKLLDALSTIMKNDNRIKWIGIYSGKEEVNYLLFEGEYVLTQMPKDFPFVDNLENKGLFMEIYGGELIEHNGAYQRCFALCGGSAMDMNGGKIIVGFSTNELDIYYRDEMLDGKRYFIVNEFGIVYDSDEKYQLPFEAEPEKINTGVIKDNDGKFSYVRRLKTQESSYAVFATCPWAQLMVKSHAGTLQISALVVVFMISAIGLYKLAERTIRKKVDSIQFGLEKIGKGDLDYRIPIVNQAPDEFEKISLSVNDVAIQLRENIDKAYLCRVKQKEAELAELQSKFDPHFLYNTLEVIRGKVYENGDFETADIIVKLAQIFRSFIGSDLFVTIQDELDFCNMYLSLLKYRYDNRVTIIYDVDSRIMTYGIIRNLLQPVLENYFIHGFKSKTKNNRLEIQGSLLDDKYIVFRVKDNGLGMEEADLQKLNESLEQLPENATGSYGLKNIHRRIKLFYGDECGLKVERNEEGGVTIEMKIQIRTTQEHGCSFIKKAKERGIPKL